MSRPGPGELMRTEDAILRLRADPASSDLISDLYLDEDSEAAVHRFMGSAEFAATLALCGVDLPEHLVVDLGAGTGIASVAWARAGARLVVSVEPDPSDVVGYGCLVRTRGELPIAIVSATGERLPLADDCAGLVFCRQVLHHTGDLDRALQECARVLRPGGVFLATREHVVDDDRQLEQFLDEHPVHQLAGGEGAYSLEEYRAAIIGAGLEMAHEMGPWDTVINAYPTVDDDAQLARLPSVVLRRRFGPLGAAAGHLPGIHTWALGRITRPKPGRFYSFAARKLG